MIQNPSRFFSVPARFDGRVVCRMCLKGSVWAWRAPRADQRPSPACLFIPAGSEGFARLYRLCATSIGWRAEIRPGKACAVYQSGPLAARVPPYAVKVWLPVGLSSSAARDQLRAAFFRLTW